VRAVEDAGLDGRLVAVLVADVRSAEDEVFMSGERFSVRLPSRMAPIWVSDPIGWASPLRAASTPERNVVETAPLSPTTRTPSLPLGFAMTGVVGISIPCVCEAASRRHGCILTPLA
jgi:hypothetical protein